MSESESSSSYEEFLEYSPNQSEKIIEVSQSDKVELVKKRKSRALPLLWSRIVDIQTDDISELVGHTISDDLQDISKGSKSTSPRNIKTWQPLFFSKNFGTEHGDISRP